MSQLDRMLKGLLYDPNDEEIMSLQRPFMEGMREYNLLPQSDYGAKEAYLKRVFASCGENCYIEQPFYANWGGHHVSVGDNFYANFCLTLVDDGDIIIGDDVMIGPNVTVATANHPMDPELRRRGLQYNRPVHIGNGVWIGAGAVIVPGVSIGDDAVIGAGSVVTGDVPAGCFAAGDPCRVIREIGERDKITYYKDDVIDTEELEASLAEEK